MNSLSVLRAAAFAVLAACVAVAADADEALMPELLAVQGEEERPLPSLKVDFDVDIQLNHHEADVTLFWGTHASVPNSSPPVNVPLSVDNQIVSRVYFYLDGAEIGQDATASAGTN